MEFHKLPKDILVKIIETGFYQDIYILIFTGNKRRKEEIVKLFTTKENLYKGYIELNKQIYEDDWEKVKRYSIIQLKNCYWTNMTEEVEADLIKYLNEEPYEGKFSIDDIRNLDDDFKIYKSSF